MKFKAFVVLLAFILTLGSFASALGSVRGLGWAEYGADSAVLLEGSGLSGLQKESVGIQLDDIKYFNGKIESAEYDFLLVSDEKSEFTAEDLAELSAANADAKNSIAQLTAAIGLISIQDGASGQGYARILENLRASRANLENGLVASSTSVSRSRQLIYSRIIQRAGDAEQSLSAAGQDLVSASENNARAAQMAQKWVNAGIAESQALRAKAAVALAAEQLDSEQIALDIESDSAIADADATVNVLEKTLSGFQQPGSGKTGFATLPDAAGGDVPAAGGIGGKPPVQNAAIGETVNQTAVNINLPGAAGSNAANEAAELKSAMQNLGQEIRTLTDALKAKKTRAKSTIAAKKTKAAPVKKSVAGSGFQKQVDALNERLGKIDDKITKMQTAAGADSREVALLRQERAALSKSVDSLMDELRLVAEGGRRLEGAVKEQAQINANNDKVLAEVRAENAGLRDSALQSRVDAIEAKVTGQAAQKDAAAARTESAATQREVSELNAELKVANERTLATQRELAQVRAETTQRVNDLTALQTRQNIAANAEVNKLQLQVAEMRGKMDGLASKAAEAKGNKITVSEMGPDGTIIKQTVAEIGAGGIVNVGGNQNVGGTQNINSDAQGAGRGTGAGTGAGEIPPAGEGAAAQGAAGAAQERGIRPFANDLPPVETPPAIKPPALPAAATPTSAVKKIITSRTAKIAGGFLAVYFITLLTDLGSYMIKSSDYPQDGSFIPPAIYNNADFTRTADVAAHYKQDFKYSELISFQGQYPMFKNFTDNAKSKVIKDAAGNDKTVSQKYQYVIFTNAGKNIFSLRDTLVGKVSKTSTKGLVLDAVLAASVSTRSTQYEYDLASFEAGDPTRDPKLVKAVYVVVFPLGPDGKPVNQPLKLDKGANFERFKTALVCGNGKTVFDWVCDLSSLGSLPKGKYVAAILTSVDNGIFTINDTVIPKAQKALVERKCNFAAEKSDKDYCEFFNSIVDQAAVDADFTQQKDNVLADNGFWTSFGSTVKGAWNGLIDTHVSSIKLLKDMGKSMFNNPKAVFMHPIDTYLLGNAVSAQITSQETLSILGLVISPLEGLVIGGKNWAKGQADVNRRFSIILDPANVSAKNAMAVGLPMFEEFEIGTGAVVATTVPTKTVAAPAPPAVCPTMAECLACIDLKLAHGVFANENYTCQFGPALPVTASFNMSTIEDLLFQKINSVRDGEKVGAVQKIAFSDADADKADVVQSLAFETGAMEDCGKSKIMIANEQSVVDCFAGRDSKDFSDLAYGDLVDKQWASVGIRATRTGGKILAEVYFNKSPAAAPPTGAAPANPAAANPAQTSAPATIDAKYVLGQIAQIRTNENLPPANEVAGLSKVAAEMSNYTMSGKIIDSSYTTPIGGVSIADKIRSVGNYGFRSDQFLLPSGTFAKDLSEVNQVRTAKYNFVGIGLSTPDAEGKVWVTVIMAYK